MLLPACRRLFPWAPQEIDFVDWVFNSSAVCREPFALRSSFFVNELTDDLSIAIVKRIQNRYGVEIWPWERAGFTRST